MVDNTAALDAPSPASAASALVTGLDSSAPTTKILRLLRVVHRLTTEARAVSIRGDQMEENLFVNNKLTAKLTRQLEEVMILARSVIVSSSTVSTIADGAAVVVCPNGRPSFRGISPSCSLSRLAIRSCSPPRLAMVASLPDTRPPTNKTTGDREGKTIYLIWRARPGRKSESLVSSYSNRAPR